MPLAAVSDKAQSFDHSQQEPQGCASLVRELSWQFNLLTGEDVVTRIPNALQGIGHTCGSDLCTVIEFDQTGTVCAHHTWTAAGARLRNLELDAEHMPLMFQFRMTKLGLVPARREG